jgi:hypothetical protein
VASRLEGLADNAQGRNSSCPGEFSGLEEDSYLKLRSGLLREFKSMSAALQQLSAGPGSRTRMNNVDEHYAKEPARFKK